MSTPETGRWFENADRLASVQADALIRFMANTFSEWDGAETATVEAPMGHVVKVKITNTAIALFAPDERRDFQPGWYLIRTDDLGFVYGFYYENEADATTDFDRLVADYSTWLDLTEN